MRKFAGFVCVLGASATIGTTNAQAFEWGWEIFFQGRRIETSVKGNDTGGIIPWSPATEARARDLTTAHCEQYGKYPRITAVHREYGDYISFHCIWNPRLARYALPEARGPSRR